MRRSVVLKVSWVVGLILMAFPTSCMLASEERGPFQGKVIDADTGRPIAGAVVLAVWWEAIFSPVGHPTERFYDAREAVTNAEGRFELPRLPVPWKLGIQPPEFHWFAPGYDTVNVTGDSPHGKRYIVPTLIEMRQIKTRDELLKKSRARPSEVPREKMMEFIKAVNIERKMLGLEPLPISVEKRR